MNDKLRSEIESALHWNNIFETARVRLRWLEAAHLSPESRAVAETLRTEWTSLTLGASPHPQRLHPDRFGRYHSRVMVQLLRHAPVVIRRCHA